METKKLPFKNYTVMNNTLIAQLSCIDTYRTFVLSLTADKTTYTTDTTLEQLAFLCDETIENYKQQKVKGYKKVSFPDKLRETNLVTVETIVKGVNGNRNIYTFKQPLKDETFRMIGKELYHLDIDNKIKGYLIKLYSIANTNTLLINKPIREIKELINMGNSTFKKYNDILIKKGYLKVTDKGLLLNVCGINAISKKPKQTKETQMYISNMESILQSQINRYNKQNKTFVNILNLSNTDILNLNLTAEQKQFAKYYTNNFKDVEDINKLCLYLQSGVSNRKAPLKKETPKNIML